MTTSSQSMIVIPISQLRALRPERHAQGPGSYHQGVPCPELNKRGGFWGPLSPSRTQALIALCPGQWPGEGLVPLPPDHLSSLGEGQPEVMREATW